MAPGRQVGCRHSTAGSPSVSASAHGRLSVRLGCSSLGSDGSRGLVSGGKPLSHSVLEMQVVVLALAAFLPQLSGQSIVLMSDNATVVVYST